MQQSMSPDRVLAALDEGSTSASQSKPVGTLPQKADGKD
jgi:hypothetical protein